MQFAMAVDLPEDGVVEGGVLVVSWIDAEGQGKLAIMPNEDMIPSSQIGLLQMASHLLHHRVMQG